MNVHTAQSRSSSTSVNAPLHPGTTSTGLKRSAKTTVQFTPNPRSADTETLSEQDLVKILARQLQSAVASMNSAAVERLAERIVMEVSRICSKSDRIQNSGVADDWMQHLAQHRLQKCLSYYHLGSKQGRVELHSTLSAMIYRHVAYLRSQLGFQARYNLIEDFLQGFYVETLRAFRRENQLAEDYTPRTRLELAEYMAFTEHYAKRRISMPRGATQRLIVLRAQSFARQQPQETAIDIEMAVESGRGEEAEAYSRSPALQQVREKMVAAAVDPTESVLRDRVLSELVSYLESQNQQDCIDYLALRLEDLSASEIDEILGLSPRQRDYLQQRFKYHLEKFSRSNNWQLVHQWLGADLDQNLGMSPTRWYAFVEQLAPDLQELLKLKQAGAGDAEIAKAIQCTPKQVQKRWNKILELAWKTRNQDQP